MATDTVTPQVDPKEEWLAERKTFIGGSEIYKLLNERQYGQGCVRALAYDKMNVAPDYPDQEDNEHLQKLFRRGNIMEPIVAQLYEEETGRKLRRPPMEKGMPKARRHPEYPWAGVHIDRLVLAGHGGVTETGTAEIKSRGEGPYFQLLRSGLFNGDNLQIQHGMFVNGHSWGPFITIGMLADGTLPIKHFDVKRDEPTIDIIKREGDRFANTVWGRMELPDRPFAGDDDRCKVCAWRMECRGEELDKAAAAALKAEKAGKTPLVQIENAALSQALADRSMLKAEIKAREETVDVIEQTIEQELGDVEAALVAGYGKVYNKVQAGRTTAELGKMMEYLRDVAMPADKLIPEFESMLEGKDYGDEEIFLLSQTLIWLRSIQELPATVASKYCKTGNPFKSMRVYPFKTT